MKYKGVPKSNGNMSPIYDKDPSGLSCTCPHNSANEDDSWRRRSKEEVFGLPKYRISGETQIYKNNTTDADSDTASSSYKPRKYRRSVSLGQILNSDRSSGHYSDDLSSPIMPHSDGLTSRGSTVYPSSSDVSPDGNCTSHELSDFEKENLLFLKDLDNNKGSRPPSMDTGTVLRPLQKSLSNTSLTSYSDESLTGGESTPRSSSPYPGRREYPSSAYSPTKKAPGGIMRSISREEPEDDFSESELSLDGCKDSMLLPRGGRKISLPPLSFSRTSSASSLSSTGGCGPAWWNTHSIRDNMPPRRSLSPGPSTASRARRLYSYRSLSSPADPNRLLEEEPIMNEPAPWRSPRSPTKLQLGGWRMEETLQEDSQDTEQEPNKKNHIGPVKPSLNSERTSNQNGGTPSSPLDPPMSNNISEDSKNKPSPMAFTVDFGGSPGTPTESNGDAAKKLDIGGSISKWAPKHRRNLSLTKVEENKKVEEGVGKPPVCRPRSGTVGSGGCGGLLTSSGRRIGGYHSEGYFSSDQDDDQANKRAQHAELKSPRSPRTPELRSPSLTPQRVVRSISHDSAKGASLRKHSSKSECDSPNERKTSLADLISKSKAEQEQKNEKMTAEVQNMTSSIQSISSCQTYDVNKDDVEYNKEIIGDDVSEAGTYTIDKDSSSPEVEQARNNIDQVFGVSATESEAEINHQRPVSTATEDNWEINAENDKYKGSTSLSRNSPNWIQQWAAQVAVHTAAPDNSPPKDGLVSPRGSKAPITSLSSSQDSSESRPRRKLPTPPAYTPSSQSVALTSSRTSDISDQESSKKPLRDPYEKPRSPLNQTRSPLAPSRLPISQSRSPYRQQGLEYLRDSECFLRDTQNLMTSLQARVDKGKTSSNRGPSFESHDSGGDSDIDTSTSYANTDQDSRLSNALNNKMKSTKIDSLTRQIAVVTSPKRVEVKSGHHLRRERSSMSEVGYDAFAARHDDQITQSDSSSETSDHAKDCRKKSDTNNPPLKFNRAFSLRRARLDEPPPQKNDKKKVARPSSAGTNSRRTPLTTSKSSQGEYGVRGSSSQATTPKSTGSDFSRGDGGRFSLRLPRSASTNAVAKSPSRTSVKKELQHGMRKGIGQKSNSTMSTKDADFQNWKRRKSYDPMKAAAEGRKKLLEKKEQQSETQERTPSPEPLSLLRSQSFHGPEGMAANTRWTRRPNNLYGSEEEGPYSLEEEQHSHIPTISPIRRSPTSPHHLSSPNHALSPHRQAQINAARRRGSYTLSDEGEANGATISRKTSLDESGSEGKHSPMGSTRGGRSKAKSEALDNLVISTIHSLSVKVRTTSETLLTKLKSQYDEDGDRAALLEDVLAHLSESDQALSATQTHSTSRELAGILRNLKKIEGALQVIDQVMVSDDEQDDEDEDLEDGSNTNHWGDDY